MIAKLFLWVFAIADQDGAVGFVQICPAQADNYALAQFTVLNLEG